MRTVLRSLLFPGIGIVALQFSCGCARREEGKAPSVAASGRDDVAAIRRVFERYRSALLAADGETAADTVDGRTMDLYEDARQDALTMQRPELERLNMMNRFMVLRCRHEFNRLELENMTGRSLFVYAVNKGWIDRSSAEKAALGGITVESDRGQARLAAFPQGPPAFFFVKEEGEWRFALWKSFMLGNAALTQWSKEAGVPETEYLLTLIAASSKFELDRAILDGPRD